MTGAAPATDPADWVARVAAVAGPTRSPRPLGGRAHLLEAGGRMLVVKPGPGASDEAEGIRRLAAVPDAPPVPEIVLAEPDLLVTTAVAQAPRTPGHDEALGRSLAGLHAHRADRWGGGSSWIGACPVEPAPAADASTFYGARLLDLSRRCGLESTLAPVVERLDELLPPGAPVVLHGDLWWGNVLFAADGRAWLIDPSVHGGLPEEDLAMLALFGPVPERTRRAYDEVLAPLPGADRRVGLFQLIPLLVHTVLFGGSYGAQAQEVAGRYR